MMLSKDKEKAGVCNVYQKAVVSCFVEYLRVYDLFRDMDDVCGNRHPDQNKTWIK